MKSLPSIVMALLPKVGPVVAALPEFVELVKLAKSSAEPHTAESLDRAYQTACDKMDEAFQELDDAAKPRS